MFVGLACISAQAGAITPTENYWQEAGGEWSGAWTNADHWSRGMIGEGQKARIPLGTDAFEIEFPRGVYTNAGELLLRGSGTRFDITLNGTNTAYVMGGAANGSTDVHSGAPFVPTYGNYTFNSYTYSGPYSAAPLAFTNFKIRWASTDDLLLLDFNGGDYNFYNPEGSALTSALLGFFLRETDSFSTNRLVRFKDATVSCGSMNVFCGEASNRASSNLLLLDNTDMTLSSTLFFPVNSGGSSGWMSPTVSEIKLDNASTLTVNGFSFSGATKNGLCSNKTFVVTLDNGSTLTQTGFDFASYHGHYVLNILNGSSATLNRSVYFGYSGFGVTDVNVVNTGWGVQGATFYIGPPTANSAHYGTMRGNLNLTNSTFAINNSLRFSSAGFDIVDSTIVGYDFFMTDPDLAVARFHANGGKYRFTKKTNSFEGDLVHDWDVATVGPRGFTIENTITACSVSQDFTDAPEGAGVLTFTGTKAFTLSSTNTTVSTVAVSGTSAAFADGAKYASTLVVTNGASVANVPASGLKGLVLGDAATTGALELDMATNVVVEGAVSFANAVLTYMAAPETGVKTTLITADSADAGTVAKWEGQSAPFAVPEGCGALFVVEESDGKKLFTVTVRSAEHATETQTAGARTVSTNVTMAAIDALTAQVSSGAELDFTGSLSLGRFEKRGEGLTVLSNPLNRFALGFGLYDGVLAATSAGALGATGNGAVSTLAGGALRLAFATPSGRLENDIEIAATASPSNAIVIDVKSEATAKAWTARSGSVLKTGSGRLSLEADTAATICISDGSGISVRDMALPPGRPVAFTPDGLYTSGAYAGLTVLEGELRLAGTAGYTAQHTFAVGGPLADLTRGGAVPGLVVDGVTVDTRNSPGGFGFAQAMRVGETVPETMRSPYLYVTNGAELVCHNFFGLSNAKGSDSVMLEPEILVDGGVLDVKSGLYLNRSSESTSIRLHCTVRNGGRIYAASSLGMQLYGSDEVVFDRGELAKNSGGEAMLITMCTSVAGTTNDFRFVNGSMFRCSKINSTGKYNDKPFVLTFDDSEWNPGSSTFTFAPWNQKLIVLSEGRGPVLAPAEGGTYTWRLDLSGTGGLVKRGLGDLVMNTTNMLYTGVTRVEEGTLDLDGSSPKDKAFAGPGTLANGTLISPVFAVGVSDSPVSTNALALAASAVVTGNVKVDLGRTAEDPIRASLPTAPFRVISYSGAAPDVSLWRLRGTGLKGVRGVFTAAGGEVKCSIVSSGWMLIVR